jgi:type III secretion system (T3SS) SseB-like protein
VADSASIPWQGRTLPPSPFADDDGQADAALERALAGLGAGPDDEAQVVEAVRTARLFAALVIHPDGSSDLALMTLSGPDGRRALPVFPSIESLSGWRPDARPVPVTGPRAAQAAVAEGCDLLELDPSGPFRHVVRRPAVWALAEGRRWTPSYLNPSVAQEVSGLATELGLSARSERGDTAELRIVLSLPPALDQAEVSRLVTAMTDALARSRLVADEVDSVELRLRSA